MFVQVKKIADKQERWAKAISLVGPSVLPGLALLGPPQRIEDSNGNGMASLCKHKSLSNCGANDLKYTI